MVGVVLGLLAGFIAVVFIVTKFALILFAFIFCSVYVGIYFVLQGYFGFSEAEALGPAALGGTGFWLLMWLVGVSLERRTR